MKILVIINYNHIASKKLIYYLRKKKINFDYIDSSKKKKIKISKRYDYLISFLNSKYIDKNVRRKIKLGSFNFHPGPPEYPGFGCYNFALLDKINFYGSTLHMMDDKFNNGKIVNVKKFKTSYKKLDLVKLINMTHINITKQAKNFINLIITGKIKIEGNLKWKRKAYTKEEFEKAREIYLKDTKANILKKIKAFTYKNYESVYVKIRGFKFEYKKK